jgi:hypothetical protein
MMPRVPGVEAALNAVFENAGSRLEGKMLGRAWPPRRTSPDDGERENAQALPHAAAR